MPRHATDIIGQGRQFMITKAHGDFLEIQVVPL